MGKVVEVKCPRCGGQGSRVTWRPDQGVCYLCRGNTTLDVDLELSTRHLAYLRSEYRRQVTALKAAQAAGEDTVLAEERLKYLVGKGVLRRSLHEAALAAAR